LFAGASSHCSLQIANHVSSPVAEHWDKNVMQDRISKHAKDHVQAYLAELEQEEGGARWAKRQRKSSGMFVS
jgi:hypothetical protein